VALALSSGKNEIFQAVTVDVKVLLGEAAMAERAQVSGLDVGGANLKMANAGGTARSMPFELWKHPGRLAAALEELVGLAPPFVELAVTMTGELCDCYSNKREGVLAILEAVERAAGGRPLRVWRNDGRFVDAVEARRTPYQVAAANWLALATWVGGLARSGAAVLLDIGSTTTDVIALRDGAPVPRGRTDPERLQTGELVYTGVRRTPLLAVLRRPPWGPAVAAEWFATMRDAYLLTGDLPEDADDRGTADGRPATVACAHARLARMRCADQEELSLRDAKRLARQAAENQETEIFDALYEVAWQLDAYPGTIIVSGSGEFLARRVVRRYDRVARVEGKGLQPPSYRCRSRPLPPGTPRPRLVSLSARLGATCSSAACAYAVAVLAAEGAHG
jgi:probable H4MPT-linked C1 transfer pathway protein